MNSIFEEHGGTYNLGADGILYPNLILEPQEHRPIGRWGRMHRAYLEAEHPGLCERLILNGTLDKHLADAQERAKEMLDKLIRQMARNESVTENLKATDQMEWIRRMNSIRNRAEEIIIDEVINRL
ncbi:MAG: TnpV protein [Anaerolineaceae bacterium]|nr:TnpV protein [Anaerolineaceae bacterium]